MSVVCGSVSRDFINDAGVPVDSAESVDHPQIGHATTTAVPVDYPEIADAPMAVPVDHPEIANATTYGHR